jgi:hypothetical protein
MPEKITGRMIHNQHVRRSHGDSAGNAFNAILQTISSNQIRAAHEYHQETGLVSNITTNHSTIERQKLSREDLDDFMFITASQTRLSKLNSEKLFQSDDTLDIELRKTLQQCQRIIRRTSAQYARTTA